MNCFVCMDTGMIETGNNDLPCDCEAGDRAMFNEAGIGLVTGEEVKQHYLNDSPEPLDAVPNRGQALVVDDDENNRRYVSKALQRGGYTVTEAKDGAEGLLLFRAEPESYAIVVSDWCMPNLMGSEMVRKILRRHPNQKILMMSSDPHLVRAELKVLHVEGVPVLLKAFTGADLLREVLNVVEGRKCEFAR